MNLMRKILSQGSTSASSPTNESAPGDGIASGAGRSGSNQSSTSTKKQHDLSLSHLQRLFHDYQNPSHPLSDSEKEDKLYMMLPLFCKVFGGMSQAQPLSESFPDSPVFIRAISRLLVTEVRRRASNQSTEEAASAIATFMEVDEASEETSNGWMLLTALNMAENELEVL